MRFPTAEPASTSAENAPASSRQGRRLRLKTKPTAQTAPARARGALRGKFQWLVLSVGVSVGLMASASAWRDSRRGAELQADMLHATAVAIGSVASEATAAGDKTRALGALQSIAHVRGVLYARIEDPAGRLLVETGSGARLLRDVEVGANGQAGPLSTLASRTFVVTAPISYAHTEVGSVVMLACSEGALNLFLSSLLTSAAVASAAMFAGLLATGRVQRSMTRPIVALTRDSRLRNDVAGLEREIAERTADLQAAKAVAEQARNDKSDLLASMDHEIRAPMNGIVILAERLAVGDACPASVASPK